MALEPISYQEKHIDNNACILRSVRSIVRAATIALSAASIPFIAGCNKQATKEHQAAKTPENAIVRLRADGYELRIRRLQLQKDLLSEGKEFGEADVKAMSAFIDEHGYYIANALLQKTNSFQDGIAKFRDHHGIEAMGDVQFQKASAISFDGHPAASQKIGIALHYRVSITVHGQNGEWPLIILCHISKDGVEKVEFSGSIESFVTEQEREAATSLLTDIFGKANANPRSSSSQPKL